MRKAWVRVISVAMVLFMVMTALPMVSAAAAAAALPVVKNERELAFELVRAYQNGIRTYKFEASKSLNYTTVLETASAGLTQYLQSISYYGTRKDEITMNIADEKEHAQSVSKAEAAVLEVITASMTPREKYKALHDWLALHCTYGEPGQFGGQSAYCALIMEKSYCAGYAKAYKLLCEKAGLPCLIVSGEGISGGKRIPHAWNAISLDGEWLMVDVTWDNPIRGMYGDYVDDTYFAVPMKDISRDHILGTKDYETYAAYLYPDRVDMAYDLKALGLFQGTSAGFSLLERPDRAQSAVMLVRLLGMEQNALAMPQYHPFGDVPAWASPHVGALYNAGLTNGVSASAFGAGDAASYEQYLTFMLRSLGYVDGKDFSWSDPTPLATRIGLIPTGLTEAVRYASRGFYRGDMVTLSGKALDCKLKGSSKTLRQKLTEEGVIVGEAVIHKIGEAA